MLCVEFVIFVGAKGKIHFPIYAKHIAQLEITSFKLVCRRLAYPDKASPIVHKFPDIGYNFFIYPVFRAAESRISIAGIDNYFYVFPLAPTNITNSIRSILF